MTINFKKVILHNFLSYGHSEIDLTNKGYCLVKGKNNCIEDNAVSNGSGKSTWVSAICYALTGETIQGVSKDLKNIFIDEDLCYVTLDFSIDSDEYEITRYFKPKSDLKIIINGVDKSGKGVRESEAILEQYLPDLNKDLLSSVILLGQGLPDKLTSLTPSNMKQRLEQLSKSDFMIEDIKSRITSRSSELSKRLRDGEDERLRLETEMNLLHKQLESVTNDYDSLNNSDIDAEIENKEEELNSINSSIDSLNSDIDDMTAKKDSAYSDLVSISNEKQERVDSFSKDYHKIGSALIERKASIESDIRNIRKEIERLKSIKDICPTCGQRIPNIVKPSTVEEEKKLSELNESLEDVNEATKLNDSEYEKNLSEFTDKYQPMITKLNNDVSSLKESISSKTKELNIAKNEQIRLSNELASLKSTKDNISQRLEELKSKGESINGDILVNATMTASNEESIKNVQKHIDVIKKMETFIKRDFRGYLLSNVIEYIDSRCKEYASSIFGTNTLDFKLDGNCIEIRYYNKQYDSLSGGEKQKVDLIVQFAVRDMLSQYLNFSSNILVLDEIFDNLDAVGVNNIINLVSTRFKDIESTFIISHHSDSLNISYDTEMNIVKEEPGISEVR